ncbi:unnamed protein product, partial [Hapterophycus canaliculatus]
MRNTRIPRSQAVGAVTSVDLTTDGMYLLASSRHGPVRTWDVRMGRPLLRYKGHQNTSSSFLRASLGAEEGLVFGGSDDSKVYVWHRRETKVGSGRGIENTPLFGVGSTARR